MFWYKFKSWKPIYWLRCHLWDRYHIIDISGQDGYRWGWIDRDHAMYLACFKILTEFVEQEDPQVGLRSEADYRGDLSENDWQQYYRSSVLKQIEIEKEVRALYDWWKTGRALAHARAGDIRKRNFDDWCAEMTRLDDQDEEMLLRLMKVRRSLWT